MAKALCKVEIKTSLDIDTGCKTSIGKIQRSLLLLLTSSGPRAFAFARFRARTRALFLFVAREAASASPAPREYPLPPVGGCAICVEHQFLGGSGAATALPGGLSAEAAVPVIAAAVRTTPTRCMQTPSGVTADLQEERGCSKEMQGREFVHVKIHRS